MTSFPFPINIVKHTNGNVLIYNDTTGDFVTSLAEDIIKIECNDLNLVKITLDNGSAEYFDPALVISTQVQPGASIPFVGDCLDLSVLFATDFFFELTSGGGGSQNLTQVLTVGNSAGNLDILDVDKLDFNLATTDVAGIGQLVWNNSDGTLDLGLKGGNVTLQIGQEQVARVVNKTSPLIDLLEANYQVVKIVGATGQRLSIALAQANNDLNSTDTIGVVTETILKNQEGFITTLGQIKEINTTGSLQGETWNDGDVLYLSPTIPGQLTKVKPIAPQHLVIVGFVEYAHAIHGKIFVKITNGFELNELHDVAYPTTPANNDILSYNSTNLRWENKTSDGFNIIVKSANQDVNNTTLTDDIDFQFPVVAGGNYMLTMVLATSSDSSLNDYKFAFAVSAGTINGVGNIVCRNASNSGTVTVISAASTITTNSVVIGQNTGSIPNVSGIVTAIIDFGFYASANGIFKFQFALNSGATTARTWKGSVLIYKRLD